MGGGLWRMDGEEWLWEIAGGPESTRHVRRGQVGAGAEHECGGVDGEASDSRRSPVCADGLE
jgi:hypothetical protein